MDLRDGAVDPPLAAHVAPIENEPFNGIRKPGFGRFFMII